MYILSEVSSFKEGTKMKKTLIVITALFLSFILVNTLLAAPAADKKKTDTAAAVDTAVTASSGDKEVQGEISAIGPDYISVIYKRDAAKGIEYEMRLPIEMGVEFEYKKNLQEFSIGDTIKATFEDTTETKLNEEKTKRKVKILSFLSPATKKPVAPTPAEPGDGIADDAIFQKNK